MRTANLIASTLLATALLGCGGTSAPADAPPPDAEAPKADAEAPKADAEAPKADAETLKLAEISLAIRANPDGYEAVLSAHGMTAQQFEAALFDVASNAERSAAYAALLAK